MKPIQIFFVFTITLLCNTTVSAQFGNNGYGNNGGGYGSNNGRMSQMNQSREPEKPKEIPAEVIVGKIMEKLKTELVLDQLQEIAISNVLI